MKYPRVKEDEWINPVRKRFKYMCCDCGLTHTMNFKLDKNGKGNTILFQTDRDERATGQARRHMKQKKEGIFK